MNYNKDKFCEYCMQHNHSWKFMDILENVLDRIENPNEDDDILQAIDDELIYYSQQWTILQEYFNPQDANWNDAIEEFINEVFSLSAILTEE